MEHIEPAGIHSGDSNAVLPEFNLSPLVVHTMEEYAEKIARTLNIKGLINIQFAIKDGNVFVIEANPRASRTTPFIAKAYQIPYLNIATKIIEIPRTQFIVATKTDPTVEPVPAPVPEPKFKTFCPQPLSAEPSYEEEVAAETCLIKML